MRYPETTKFLKWFNEQKKAGLIDIKLFLANTTQATSEEVFAELNRAIAAPEVADPDVF